MKIQDRYRQGLIAACLSQRRTVEAETDPARARAATSRTNYGHDHRAGGAWDWDSAGHWQASALTSGICTGMNEVGRPERLRSARPGRRCAANGGLQVRTDSRRTPLSRAIRVLARPGPRAAECARTRVRCGVLWP